MVHPSAPNAVVANAEPWLEHFVCGFRIMAGAMERSAMRASAP